MTKKENLDNEMNNIDTCIHIDLSNLRKDFDLLSYICMLTLIITVLPLIYLYINSNNSVIAYIFYDLFLISSMLLLFSKVGISIINCFEGDN